MRSVERIILGFRRLTLQSNFCTLLKAVIESKTRNGNIYSQSFNSLSWGRRLTSVFECMVLVKEARRKKAAEAERISHQFRLSASDIFERVSSNSDYV